jgi:hypothetical protein
VHFNYAQNLIRFKNAGILISVYKYPSDYKIKHGSWFGAGNK